MRIKSRKQWNAYECVPEASCRVLRSMSDSELPGRACKLEVKVPASHGAWAKRKGNLLFPNNQPLVTDGQGVLSVIGSALV